MAHKRSNGRGASRQSEGAAGSGLALRWYSLGVASGLFMAFLFYMATLPADLPVSAGGESPAVAEAPAPQFDFYELLPRRSIDVQVDPAQMPKRRTDGGGSLLLQAGSFRQAEDADRRRAELLLLGLEPSVEESNGDNGRWYRVVIGPFENRSAMARAQSLTAQQDIDTLLVRREG